MALPTVGTVFGVFRNFVKHFVIHFVYVEKMIQSECLGLVNHLFNSSYNIDLSNKVTRRLKICVSFTDKYIWVSS